jgi:nicotinamide-nucleotide amidase
MKQIEEKVGHLLRSRGETISVAESCTGGLIAHRITSISGSSDYFESGVISYSNQAKTELLGVPSSLIIQHGAVSEPVAKAMAEGVRARRKTALGLAATGVAGPLGGTTKSPVGTVFIALASPEGTTARRFQFTGERTDIKTHAAEKALEMILEYCAGPERDR